MTLTFTRQYQYGTCRAVFMYNSVFKFHASREMFFRVRLQNQNACTHAHTCAHTHTHARTHTHAHEHTHTCTHAHPRIHTHTDTHAHTHIGEYSIVATIFTSWLQALACLVDMERKKMLFLQKYFQWFVFDPKIRISIPYALGRSNDYHWSQMCFLPFSSW